MVELNATETLFGGLLAVVALYLITRRLGLSNYWSGVLAGALPFLGYLGYSMVVWQGGDMVAIHLAVFMATAAVLGVFDAVRKGSKEKMHWAPKAIAAFFGALVVFNAILLSISSHGLPDKLSGWFLPNPESQRLHTAFPGIIPHDRNKLYEQHMKRIEEQRNLGWKLELSGLDDLRSGVPSKVVVKVKDAESQPVVPEKVEFVVWRMANSKDDRHVQLKAGEQGAFVGELLLPNPGKWLVRVDVTRGEDVFMTNRSLFVDEPAVKK